MIGKCNAFADAVIAVIVIRPSLNANDANSRNYGSCSSLEQDGGGAQ